jgi:hypothetical protein
MYRYLYVYYINNKMHDYYNVAINLRVILSFFNFLCFMRNQLYSYIETGQVNICMCVCFQVGVGIHLSNTGLTKIVTFTPFYTLLNSAEVSPHSVM